MARYNVTKTRPIGFYDVMNRFFTDDFAVDSALRNLTLDVQELADKYIVEVDVPGVAKNDIDISLKNDYLKIAIENTEEAAIATDEEKNYIHRERRFTIVSRVVYLKNADRSAVKATVADGVLTITVPKQATALEQTEKILID